MEVVPPGDDAQLQEADRAPVLQREDRRVARLEPVARFAPRRDRVVDELRVADPHRQPLLSRLADLEAEIGRIGVEVLGESRARIDHGNRLACPEHRDGVGADLVPGVAGGQLALVEGAVAPQRPEPQGDPLGDPDVIVGDALLGARPPLARAAHEIAGACVEVGGRVLKRRCLEGQEHGKREHAPNIRPPPMEVSETT